MDVRKVINMLNLCELRDLHAENFEERIIDVFESEFSPFYTVGHGTTKGVIDIDGISDVIKIPFAGIAKGDFDMLYFRNGGWKGKNCTDYCYAEMKLGEEARRRGLDEIFIPTIYICTIQGVPIYIQQKVDCDNYDGTTDGLTNDDMSTAERYKTETGCDIDELWLSWINHCYGEEMVQKVIDFVDDYGINDLNYYNLGWDACGRPVAFDYAGFMD